MADDFSSASRMSVVCGKLRVALRERSRKQDVPARIFINGESIGGCTELFERCKDGRLIEKLEQLDIPRDGSVSIDSYFLLPGWLHSG